MKKHAIKYALVLLVLAVGAAAGAWGLSRQKKTLMDKSASVNSSAVREEARTIDYSDNRVLLGHTHNAFVGKVLRKTWSGHLQDSYGNSSQYEVDVISNIKGNLHGTVVVNQFEFETPFLDIGSTYIFAARYYPDGNFYFIVYYPYEYQLLTDDSSLSDAQLKTLAENNDRLKALQAAYPNEELGSDIRDHMTWNSYASRHYDASGQLIDDTVVLHEQYMAAHPATSTESAPVAPATKAPTGNSVASPVPSDVTASDVASPTPSTDAAAPTDTPTPTLMPTPTPTPTDSTAPTAS
jgi:hypothetical protein